jgi:hypothetical protein
MELIADPIPCDHCGEHRPCVRLRGVAAYDLCRKCLAAALELFEDEDEHAVDYR